MIPSIEIHQPYFIFESVQAILTDIEGTTTSISFVHDTLFPYAKAHVKDYLLLHAHKPELQKIIEEVKQLSGMPEATLEEVAAILYTWMQQDKKITPLKTIQGWMWEEGYKQGDFQGHVYPDAYENLISWHQSSIPLYIYSSGSIHAQKLLFGHSNFGDLTPLFSGHFDTTTGPKKEASSYQIIAEKIQLPPSAILFLSDSIDEIKAARSIGMQTALITREAPTASSFDQIIIRSATEAQNRVALD